MTTTANSASNLTLLDLVKRQTPDHQLDLNVIELLTMQTPCLEDMVWKEGNLPTGHRFTNRNALPSVAWRRINQGVTPSKSTTGQVDETVGLMAGYSYIDVELAAISGNPAAFRMSEQRPFLQAFSNELETAVFYHSTANTPEKIQGLSPRYNSLTGAAKNQVVAGDGTAADTDATSMWLVGWGDFAVHGITPKGSPSGLSHRDLGIQPWDIAGDGKKLDAYVSSWTWKVGLAVEDQRQCARITNIDVDALTASGSTGTDLIPLAVQAYHKINNPKSVRLAWYCNRTIATYLHLQAMNATKNSSIWMENVENKGPVMMLLGIPVRVTDALVNTETAI